MAWTDIASQIVSGAQAQRAGQDASAAVSGNAPTLMETNGMGGVRVADEEVATRGDEDTSPLLSDLESDSPGEETSEDGEETEVTAADQKAPTRKSDEAAKSRRKLAVDKGKSFIEVDYENREAIDRAHLLAHGARKWQAERDQARKELDQIRSAHEPLRKHWDTLEGAFREKGIEGVIDLLEGSPGSYQKHLQSAIQRENFLRNASPEEKAALEAREAVERQQREIERIRKENEDFRKSVEQQREEAETRALESKIHPSFEKYRFKGKLGNADREHLLDEMVWNSALRKLEPYEEQGLEITPEVIDSEFRKAASAIRSTVSATANKAAAKTVERKKQQATEHAQAAVRSGMGSSAQRQAKAKEAMSLIDQGSGGLTNLLKGWNTNGYGKLFSR